MQRPNPLLSLEAVAPDHQIATKVAFRKATLLEIC